MNLKLFYCQHCGKIIAIVKNSCSKTMCCEHPMLQLHVNASHNLLEDNSTNFTTNSKHCVPIISVKGKTNAEWEAKFQAKVNEIAKSTRERYAKEAEREKMTAEEKVKADYEDKITTLTEELGKKTKEIKDRKINEAILSNELPSYYKNDIRLINADDENFDKVIKDIKAEHNDYLKTLLQQNVKSTSPNIQKDSNNTSNETRDRVLAKVGIRTK